MVEKISTVAGVDTFDHCISINSCRRKTNRWTFNIFMFLIDAAAQNAFALFKMQNEEPVDKGEEHVKCNWSI